MSDRAKEALRAESSNLAATSRDILFSGAYLYPFKGLLHFATHPPLYKPLWSRITQTLIAGVGITISLFLFTYLPQTTFLTFTAGPFFAPIAGVLLVLSEASAITHFVARAWIIRDALVDVFDAVLLSRGCENLVRNGRELKSPGAGGGKGVMGRLGRLLKSPFGSSTSGGGSAEGSSILRSIMLLPLNFIPVIGTVMYVYVAGKKAGPGLHARYFQLKGFDRQQREDWVRLRRGGYTGLGMASTVLEMVPFASMVFEFSNAVGAALWAADLERASK
ncbi:uncharacterized protein BDV17DRAFT_141389 [Aspergillus undulatus]|uniref:uncharacterized protein n=1 Tax=Aspergillus undulatus TaxID=1810928 RepID=UPI003CCDD59E